MSDGTTADADDWQITTGSGVSAVASSADTWTVTIPSGMRSATITVTAPDDADGDGGVVIFELQSGTDTGYSVGSANRHTLTITDNDAEPVFSAASYSFSIGEGKYSTSSPGEVGTVSATNATRYAITAGNSDTRFAIDSNGAITAVGELDFEDTAIPNSYDLTVTAHNGAGTDVPSATALVTITVTDVDYVTADDLTVREDGMFVAVGDTTITPATTIDLVGTSEYTFTKGGFVPSNVNFTTGMMVTSDPAGGTATFTLSGTVLTAGGTADNFEADNTPVYSLPITISNLTINRSSLIGVGLFANINGGSVQHLFLKDVNISGRNFVGGIVRVGTSTPLLYFVAVTGAINTHNADGGGIIGNSSNAHAAGTVRGDNSSSILNGLQLTSSLRNVYGRSSVMDGSGSLIGFTLQVTSLQATNVYWDTESSNQSIPVGAFQVGELPTVEEWATMGITGLNTAGMQALTGAAAGTTNGSGWQTEFASGIDLDGDNDMDDANDMHLSVRCDVDGNGTVGATEWLWDFGTTSQYPALNCMPISLAEQRAANRQ